MMLKMTLLGGVVIRYGGEEVHFRTQKEAALLVFLAHTNQPHLREEIADMLWDLRTTAQSLSNLRTVLARTRSRTGETILSSGKTLWVDRAICDQVDSVQLKYHLDKISRVQSPEDAAQLAEIVHLYTGNFLHGFYLPDAPRFNDWVVMEMESIRQQVLNACQLIVTYTLECEDYEVGISVVRHWLRFDSWNEAAHYLAMRLYAESGQLATALAQYEQCKAIMADQFGVSPEPETTTLYQSIRQQIAAFQKAKITTKPKAAHNVTRQLTPFFGRTAEMNQLAKLLPDAGYPLITITGEGGIGKTCLALAAARKILEGAHPFVDGIWFVPLATISPAGDIEEEIAIEICKAIPIQLLGERTPAQQFKTHLKNKNILLIIDNFEHLQSIEAINFIFSLIEENPGVQLLVTSQLPLDLNAEYAIRLAGLPAPDEVDNLVKTDDWPSLELFRERASRQVGGFNLADQMEGVVRICQLVHGSPLGIELAAANMQGRDCKDVAAAIKRNYDFLSSSRQDIPPRQRSMRALFDYSWSLLSLELRRALTLISVFQGGFTQNAALHAVGVTEGELSSLVRHSLLQKNGQGRYSLHALLQNFLLERLAEWKSIESADNDIYNFAFNHHSEYYLSSLGKPTTYQYSISWSENLRFEAENIRAAWQWAVNNCSVELIATGWEGLMNSFLSSGMFLEGENTFAYAEEHLIAKDEDNYRLHFITCAVQCARSAFLNALGKHHQARDKAELATRFAVKHGEKRLLAFGSYETGVALSRQGHFDEALIQLEIAQKAAHQTNQPNLEAGILRRIGTNYQEKGDYPAATEYLQNALSIYRGVEDQTGAANALTSIGWLYLARQLFLESLDISSQSYLKHLEINNLPGARMALINMSAAYDMMGNYSEAIASREKAQLLMEGSDDPYHRSLINHGIGVGFSRMGVYEAAKVHYECSLELDQQIGDLAGIAWSQNNLGLLYNHLGEYETALDIHLSALQTSEELGARTIQGLANLRVGQDLSGLSRYDEARQYFESAIAIQGELKQDIWKIESEACLARTYSCIGLTAEALLLVEEIIGNLTNKNLHGAREPMLIYWNIYLVMKSAKDSRAGSILDEAYHKLNDMAEKISILDWRESFLNSIMTHQALRAEWEFVRAAA